MESIGYMLIYLLKGQLPWQGLKIKQKNEKYEKIREMKIDLDINKLCEGIPEEFGAYIKMVRKLEFEEEPEYAKYINLFDELFKKKEFIKDYAYDWVSEEDKKRQKNIKFKESRMYNNFDIYNKIDDDSSEKQDENKENDDK